MEGIDPVDTKSVELPTEKPKKKPTCARCKEEKPLVRLTLAYQGVKGQCAVCHVCEMAIKKELR